MANALIVVDVQNDFCEGGSLGVASGAAVAAAISAHMAEHSYDHIVATRDYHIDPGSHFSATPDYVDSWPPHCVAGSAGAAFHPELDIAPIEAVFSKGGYAAAYSGFEGATGSNTMLADWLRDNDVTQVDIAGIATDHCVKATALDAARAGFRVNVLLSLTAGVSPATVDAALAQLKDAEIELTGTLHSE